MASQMVSLVMVRRKACWRPAVVKGTAPICVMPCLSIRSPALAQMTMMRIMRRVLRRRRCSEDIIFKLEIIALKPKGCGTQQRYEFSSGPKGRVGCPFMADQRVRPPGAKINGGHQQSPGKGVCFGKRPLHGHLPEARRGERRSGG